MDNAGRLSAQFFVEKTTNPFNQKVLVLAGKGDNGGDAIIMHHYLRQYGVDSKLYLFDFNYSTSRTCILLIIKVLHFFYE